LGDAAGAYKGDHGNEDADDDTLSRQTASSYQSSSHVASPILEIPEEVYQVRKSALQVLKPLTKTWVRSRVLLVPRAHQGCLVHRPRRVSRDFF
jgi:hypothetical protein